jgi:hypothetical protein
MQCINFQGITVTVFLIKQTFQIQREKEQARDLGREFVLPNRGSIVAQKRRRVRQRVFNGKDFEV